MSATDEMFMKYSFKINCEIPAIDGTSNCSFSKIITRHTYICHYSEIIMGWTAPQITSLTIVSQPFIQGADQTNHQSSASLAFVREIHQWPMNSPHKGSVTRKMFPFDDVIMYINIYIYMQTRWWPSWLIYGNQLGHHRVYRWPGRSPQC